jgi:hypothetical protein
MSTVVVELPELDPQTWAEEQFGELDLGHEKRNQRAVTIAAAFATQPGKSIPQIFDSGYAVKAAYQFFANEAVTPDEVQATHRERTLARLQQPGTYLLVEDTTDPPWRGKKKRPGLGPVGDRHSTRQGFQLHSTLALCWPDDWTADPHDAQRPALEIIGLADQQSEVRKPKPSSETRHERLLREREAEIWEATTTRLGTAPATHL